MEWRLFLLLLLPVADGLASFHQTPKHVETIPGEYVAVLKPDHKLQLSSSQGVEVLQTFNIGSKRFARVKVDDGAVSDLLRDPSIEFVEPNRVIYLDPVRDARDSDEMSPQPLATDTSEETRYVHDWYKHGKFNCYHGDDYGGYGD